MHARGAGCGREYEIIPLACTVLHCLAHAWIILRKCNAICACVLAIDLGFVTTPRALHVYVFDYYSVVFQPHGSFKKPKLESVAHITSQAILL